MRIRKALISVTDKTGIVEFAKVLEDLGIEIISTGGTAKLLRERGVKVTYIGDYTGFPEIMDGRVRTLHPKIHGGILAVRENKDHMNQIRKLGITPIDMVVVNLYQFEKTIRKKKVDLQEAIENIDIGGPTLIRSAAKNYKDVLVITDPKDYEEILSKLKEKGDVDLKTRELLAVKAFRRTADYDSEIDKFLSRRFRKEDILRMKFLNGKKLRYGENWHQHAKIFRKEGGRGIVNAKQLHGKEMSYNNYVDADAALEAIMDLKGKPGVVIIKHTNPCGFATGGNLREAFEHAWQGDPISAFGSVIAVNRKMDLESAKFLKGKFIEVLIAPSFERDALSFLKSKSKNLRILEIDMDKETEKTTYRFVSGGLLQQDKDVGYIRKNEIKCVTKMKFPEGKKDLAIFACLAAKHTKSNAIVICYEYSPLKFMVLGMGAGQPNRVDSLRKLAVTKAKENIDLIYEKRKPNLRKDVFYKKIMGECVLASDSFFPFDDSIKEAKKAGIKYIIQPGGSIRDQEIIETANTLGMCMAFTGRRCFRH
jgi:phosphoribosylaminoimidazolecarboxamide formyltransferase/IMP cyclohydrolase